VEQVYSKKYTDDAVLERNEWQNAAVFYCIAGFPAQ